MSHRRYSPVKNHTVVFSFLLLEKSKCSIDIWYFTETDTLNPAEASAEETKPAVPPTPTRGSHLKPSTLQPG